MKILMVRIAGHISGAEVYNLNLLTGWKRIHGLRVFCITNLPSFATRLRWLSARIACLPSLPKEVGTKKQMLRVILLLPIVIAQYLYLILSLERGKKFDVVCLQSMTEKIFLTPLLRLLRYKVVWIEHGPLYASSRTSVIKYFYQVISTLVNKIIAVSEDTKRDLESGGIDQRNVVVCTIGIDTDVFSPLQDGEKSVIKKRLRIEGKSAIIGFIGTVTKEKGIEDFILCANTVLRKRGDCFFLVVGDGPFLSWAKDHVRKLGIGKHFLFTGFQKDIRSYIGIMDMVLFPTHHHEGLSIALLEALSMGKVVIASDMGGNRELIFNGKTGYIYVPTAAMSDVAQIIMHALLSNRQNQNIRKQARFRIQRYHDIYEQAGKLYAVFQTL